MTLDEAIKHAEEVAESQEYEAKKLEESGEKYHDGYENYCASKCFECAAEHRQLAEWLKELKGHREAWMKVKLAIDYHTEIHSDGEFYIRNFDVKKIIAEYRPKEGDAE